MQHPKILVAGAAGKTGSAVVAQLTIKGVPVRAIVRARDVRSERLDRLGAETVVADLFDPDQLRDAMRGVQRAYYLPFFHPYMLQSATAFAVAARESRLEAIVQMSQWLAQPSHPSIVTRQTWMVDHVFAMIPGVAHVIVNPGMFADNFLRMIDYASLLGVYPILTGNGRSAPISNEDIARVVVALLLEPDRHAGMRYRPTGPELLSGGDMARAVAKVLGHRVVPFALPFWMFRKVARMQRIDPAEISGFRHYVEEMKRGAFEFEGGVNDVVADLTSAPAESFEATARRYRDMPFAQATAANRLKSLLNLNLVPFYPAYDLDRWDRLKGFPMPSNPRFSIDDERWRTERSLQNANQSRPRSIRAGAAA